MKNNMQEKQVHFIEIPRVPLHQLMDMLKLCIETAESTLHESPENEDVLLMLTILTNTFDYLKKYNKEKMLCSLDDEDSENTGLQ